MDTGWLILLGIIVLAGLVAYALWRGNSIKAMFGAGGAQAEFESAPPPPQVDAPPASAPLPPGAEMEVGNISGSRVSNEGAGGGARLKAQDITDSTVKNTNKR